jgi:hypothetical protein
MTGRLVVYELDRYAEMSARCGAHTTLDIAEEILEIVKELRYLALAKLYWQNCMSR